MFLHHLNDRQASVFLFLAERVVMADGKIKYQELAKVSSFLRQINPEIVRMECSFGELPGVFDSRKARICTMLELILLAFADNDYVSSEDDLINRLGRSLEISNDEMARMKEWGARQAVLAVEADAFLGITTLVGP